MSRVEFIWLASWPSWLGLCLLSPYGLWQMIASPLTDISLTRFIVLQMAIALIMIAGSFCAAYIYAAELGFLVVAPLFWSVLAIASGTLLMALIHCLNMFDLWVRLMPNSQSLPELLNAADNPIIAFVIGIVLILALIPYIIVSIATVATITITVRMHIIAALDPV